MAQKVIKWLKYAGWAFLSLIVLIALFATVLHVFYAENIKRYLISELNRQIKTPVEVGSVEFSVIQGFPRASIVFNRILAHPPKDFRWNNQSAAGDTLFYFNRLVLEFNIREMLKKNYVLERINASNGLVKVQINESGAENYRFWAESASDSGDFRLQLKQLRFRDFRFQYADRVNAVSLSGNNADLKLKGNFSSSAYRLILSTQYKSENLKIGNMNFPVRQPVKLDAVFDAGESLYTIRQADLKISDLAFLVSGQITNAQKLNFDLSIKGNKLDIPAFLSLLPAEYANALGEYKSEGSFRFSGIVKGPFGDGSYPLTEFDVGIENSRLSRKNSPIELKKLNIRGHFSNGSEHSSATTELRIQQFSFVAGEESQCSGNFTLNDFNTPYLNIRLNGHINLTDILALFPTNSLKNTSGQIDFKLETSGKLSDFTGSGEQIVSRGTNKLQLEFKNLCSRPGPSFNLENATGNLQLSGDNCQIETEARLNSTSFVLRGSLMHLPEYLFNSDKVLEISGELKIPEFDVEKTGFFAVRPEENNTKQKENSWQQNIRIGKLTIGIERLKSARFQARDLKSQISFSYPEFEVQSLNMRTLNGNYVGKGRIRLLEGGAVRFNFDNHCSQLDIHELFYSFKNFNQEFLKAGNITGSLTGQIKVEGSLDKNGNVVENELIMKASVKVENGELHNFEPMKKLSEFIKVQDLNLVKFSKLENTISIENRVVSIPEMEIKSSAFGISLSGQHSMDQQFDYRIKLKLAEILANKARLNNKQNNEFGEEVDASSGTMILHLIVAGTPDKFDVKYDTKRATQSIKDEVKTEKTTIKKMLNDDFGWFKKDTSIRQEKKNPPKTKKVRISFDENDEPSK